MNIITSLSYVICTWKQIKTFIILETKEVSSSEELVLNTVATINNLSFYNTKTSAITTLQVRVLEGTNLDYTVFCYLWAN